MHDVHIRGDPMALLIKDPAAHACRADVLRGHEIVERGGPYEEYGQTQKSPHAYTHAHLAACGSV
jgi:hypothetical protein